MKSWIFLLGLFAATACAQNEYTWPMYYPTTVSEFCQGDSAGIQDPATLIEVRVRWSADNGASWDTTSVSMQQANNGQVPWTFVPARTDTHLFQQQWRNEAGWGCWSDTLSKFMTGSAPGKGDWGPEK